MADDFFWLSLFEPHEDKTKADDEEPLNQTRLNHLTRDTLFNVNCDQCVIDLSWVNRGRMDGTNNKINEMGKKIIYYRLHKL
jgi:hypothetical protein